MTPFYFILIITVVITVVINFAITFTFLYLFVRRLDKLFDNGDLK